MIFNFLTISISLLTGFSESSSSSNSFEYLTKVSKDTWDPKNDAIYDSVTGFCHFEDCASHRFLPSSLKLIKGKRDANSFIETDEITTDEILSEMFSSPSSQLTTHSTNSSPF